MNQLQQPVAPKRRFPLQTILSIATIVLVATMLGLQVYWKYYALRWDGLANQVLTSMDQFLASDEQLGSHSPQVTNITVMHAAENTFEAQATVTASGVASREVPVHIVYDGENMFWRTDPGAFLFITMGNS